MLTPAEADLLIGQHLQCLPIESLPLAQCGGTVLRENIYAERDQPPFDRVAMDGVAVDSQTLGAGTRSFRVQATQAAGDPPLTLAAAGDCIEVMTGAVLPVGCDCVIPVEELSVARGQVALAPGARVEPWQHVHRRGSDTRQGTLLLSSLAGAAVTSVRIEGVAHEFSTIKGVTEDVTDIVLNLKGIVCKMHSDATEVEAPLVVTGPGEITAKDIDLPAGVEILNPDVHIATLEKKTKLEMYMTIGRGRGYRPAEENKSPDQPIGVIPIDSIFSPVRRVAYAVEGARVGQRTDYDKLTLDIETDGSIDPPAALREAAEILISQLAIFTDPDRVVELRAAGEPGVLEPGLGAPGAVGAGSRQPNAMDDILIEELELGVRSYNCLKRAGVQTVGDLVRKSRAELNAIPNFGQKSIEEVIETLHARGLDLQQD